MNQILHCDWLSRQYDTTLPAWDYLICPARKKCFFFHIINPFIDQACLVKMAGYWPCSFFCVFMDQNLPISNHVDLMLGQQPILHNAIMQTIIKFLQITR